MHKKRTAQVSVRDRDATRSFGRADTEAGDNRRDPECLDAYEYWDPVLEYEFEEPLTLASELTLLPVTSWKRFARDLHNGRIERIFILSDAERVKCEAEEL
ncbi:hypothetical protein PF005_g17829 [Phytophthora fragariae]|uniref:Uncharacterized protein n=1 Tax=Phytophthora fragariae TaxID=53985 RepID=A0A6A3XWT2_9STRA|nr:hypothetical protein PF003_g6238 [Phytophthora fragariae]KAE8991941.1 hypothetical protein PF011_g17742 [Phytophthora fragariae]KAE9071877.1 hypothetical protein PF007_g26384 [Phytophthora fragariae]KAE9124995.1 hypothetical protein PF006_g17064 [Phytophthora fragariae]KAE9194092.1 hypothetical protein PF005_g17829 [Phytophthora fragariae]